MTVDIDFPDLSNARFRRDVGVGRLNALVAYVVGVTIFLLTMRMTGELNVLVFTGSYASIPCCLAIGMAIERDFEWGRLFQASLLVALVKFVTTIGLHLMQSRILAALGQ